jgi:hypothetical protein
MIHGSINVHNVQVAQMHFCIMLKTIPDTDGMIFIFTSPIGNLGPGATCFFVFYFVTNRLFRLLKGLTRHEHDCVA